MNNIGQLIVLFGAKRSGASEYVNDCKRWASLDRVLSEYEGEWVNVAAGMPPLGIEVRVIRDFKSAVLNPAHPAYGKRYGIERSTRLGGTLFSCELQNTGPVIFWSHVNKPVGNKQ